MLRRSRDFRRHLIPLAANELGPRIPGANLSEVSVHERVCVAAVVLPSVCAI